MSELTQEDRIIRAKIKLGHFDNGKPFFAHLLSFAKITEDSNIPTMCVDIKGNIRYNKEFVSKVDDEELKFCLCHEVCHLAFNSFLRKGEREHKKWNIATDIIINNILKNDGFKLPEMVLIPENNEYTESQTGNVIKNLDKKSAEVVYEEIKDIIDELNKKGNQSGNGDSENGDISQSDFGGFKNFDFHDYSETNGGENGNEKGLSDEELGKIEKEWTKRLVEALTQAKMNGNIPKGMERLVDIHINNFVDWKSLLSKYITNNIPTDYTFSRPRKSSRAIGVYLPSVLKENIEIYVAIDTSGSISEEDINDFVGEMLSITRSVKNVKMTIIDCDCKINSVVEVKDNYQKKLLNLDIRGGGGTSHIPVYDWIKENGKNPKVLVNFTDGHTDFPDNPEQYNFKSLWVLATKYACEDDNIPFGDIIRLEK